MNIFFDPSAFIKKFIQEQGSAEVDDYCQQASMLGLSIICLPEMMSALNRKTRLFISSDKRQIQAAEKSGLQVKYVQ